VPLLSPRGLAPVCLTFGTRRTSQVRATYLQLHFLQNSAGALGRGCGLGPKFWMVAVTKKNPQIGGNRTRCSGRPSRGMYVPIKMYPLYLLTYLLTYLLPGAESFLRS